MKPLSTQWLPIAFLTAELGFVAMLLLCFISFVSNTKWQKIFCQAAMLTVVLIIGCDFSGVGNLLVARFRSTTVIRTKARIPTADSDTSEAVPLVGTPSRPAEPDRVMPSSIEQAGAAPVQRNESSAVQLQQPRLSPRISSMVFQGFCVAWVAGVLVLAVRSGLGRLAPLLPRWRRSEIRDGALPQRVKTLAAKLEFDRPIRLLESPRLSGPIAFGIFRPTVALPLQFQFHHESGRQDAMLIHELAHLRGNDPAWYLLSEAATVLVWWHPALWWLRRQLQIRSELAADEASLLVEDGPGTLAECLVQLGARLVDRQWAGELPIAAFRSNLGRRVERLLDLAPGSHPKPRLAGAVLVRALGAVMATSLLIFSVAWLTPNQTMKGNSTMKAPWQNSIFTVTLMTALQSIVVPHASAQAGAGELTPAASAAAPAPRSDQDKFRARYGLPPLADAGDGGTLKAQQPSGPRSDPSTEREMRRRYGLGGALPGNSNTIGPARSPGQLESRLKHIVLDHVVFERMPLSEVIRNLSDVAAKNDPEHSGINFLIHNNAAEGTVSPQMIDPTTGFPAAAAAEPLDVGSVIVNINPALHRITMMEALEAIVKVADHPIQYTVEDYAVVFSPRATNAALSPMRHAASLGVRTFKVNTNTFAAGLQSAFGITVHSDKVNGIEKPDMKLAMTQLFTALGISTDGGQSIFYNELNGMVMVRANQADMRVVEAAMDTLSGQSTGGLELVQPDN